MPSAIALIVDDEPDIRQLLEITLARMNLRTEVAANLAEAKSRLKEHHFDLCLTDMRLPDGSGIELVAEIQLHHPNTPVAVITAYGNTQAAVDSLKAGAFDFVSKPVDLPVLRKLVDAALKLRGTALASSVTSDLLGESPSMHALRAMIERVARSQAPVHVAGESGTGKELVAKSIHAHGPRADAPFVPINCGAIPTELMESEFFGHVKGSFTGAIRDKAGLFQSAEGGTLFLDEVAELPLHMQAKLLRALQERTVRPIGSEAEIPTNVRIISATHQNLAERVAAGTFRQDLFYRLNVIELQTPTLRQHPDDIPLLANAIVRRIASNNALTTPPKLAADALRDLKEHPFPGNVRELENILERAVALCDGSIIRSDDLQLRSFTQAAAPATAATNQAADLSDRIETIERGAIVDALEKTRWNKTRAAELLGISFRQLRYRIKKLGIE